MFRHKKLDLVLASYVDDLLIRSKDRAAAEHVLKLVAERFNCKELEPTFLGVGSPIDHLGMFVHGTNS